MKRFLLLPVFALLISIHCMAIDHNTDNILRIVKLDPSTSSQNSVISILGQPGKIEEGKKKSKWFYNLGNCSMVIFWKKKVNHFEKVLFTNEHVVLADCNMDLQQKLKNGLMDIEQTFKLLGTPADMTLKQDTQVMHYSYHGSTARLFFRNSKLVDFALVEAKN